MFRASLCPSSGEQRPYYCIWCIVLVLLDVVGSACGALSCRMWSLWSEFPCISSRTSVTGTEGKEHVAVFDVYVRISRPFCHSCVLLPKVWVYVTWRCIVMTALPASVLSHLAVTCVGTESCSQVIRCVTFSTYFWCNEGIALWRGCMPVSFHLVQQRSQYCHEEPTRRLNGQHQMWGG